jgi:hypothetical protein
MPSVARTLTVDLPLYSMADLVEQRRNILRYARSLPPGPARNRRRQVALSLRALFKNEKWLQSHTLEGAGLMFQSLLPIIIVRTHQNVGRDLTLVREL